MSFEIPPASYDRFMGRYSRHLSPQLADLAGVATPQRVLDVGSGSGALTDELVRRLGATAVTAVDPSERFVAAVRERHPRVTVHRAAAEQLPFPDRAFDAALAQLVVHFMDDPLAGLREMARVTGSGGTVAACVWDHAEGGQGPLSPFFRAAHALDPAAPAESERAGARQGHLAELFRAAGIGEVEETVLIASVDHPTFEEWWEPYTLSVGPVGQFIASLDQAGRARLRELCRATLPPEPFTLNARAWAVRGVVR
jgi:SAM-dependent methyltransferase